MNIKYRFWKQITFELLMNGSGTGDTCATKQQVTDLLESELGPAAPGTLEMLAHSALVVYGIMNCSAQDYSMTFRHPDTGQLSGFLPDITFMEIRPPVNIEELPTEETVDLVVAPLVRVSGSIFGTDGPLLIITEMKVVMSSMAKFFLRAD